MLFPLQSNIHPFHFAHDIKQQCQHDNSLNSYVGWTSIQQAMIYRRNIHVGI